MNKHFLLVSVVTTLVFIQQPAFASHKTASPNLSSPQYQLPNTATKELCEAAMHANMQILPLLVQEGADVNNENCNSPESITPLMRSVSSPFNNIGVFTFLMSNGAAVNYQTKNGETALMYLFKQQWADGVGNSFLSQVLPALVDAGANVNAEDSSGDTAMIILVNAGYSQYTMKQTFKSIKYLAKQGADVNHQDHQGLTSLMLAAKGCGIQSTELLLALGAKTNIKTKMGDTAMSMAIGSASGTNSASCNDVVRILQNPQQYETMSPDSITGISAMVNQPTAPVVNPLQGLSNALTGLSRAFSK